ncbi:DUF1737 domain-containing protein [Zobellia nedashkovskayae]|nr:DUF1737 domain-containing protein [Zobellia nedashkovskayae]
MKTIKILEGEGTKDLENKVNSHIGKGWKLKGNIFSGIGCLVAVVFKK